MASASAPPVLPGADLAGRYRAVRARTEALAAPLSAEDCCVQSMPEASPVKWHLAHTSWFFETFVLEPRVAGYRPFHPRFRVLFNSYYQSVGPQHPRPRRGLLTRPSLDEVRDYRAHVDRSLLAWLERTEPDTASEIAVVELGIHHEQQHQELLLTDVKSLLASNPLRPAYREPPPAPPASPLPPLRMVHFLGGLFALGHDGRGFSFDSERPRHRVVLERFALASRLVTSGEMLGFIADGGYRRPELWLSDGWDWVAAQGIRAPLYWEEEAAADGGWIELTLGGPRPVERSAPVCHVSYYEADAYARWAGARLPTEAEWEVVAAALEVEGNLLESGRLHPAAAGESLGSSTGGQDPGVATGAPAASAATAAAGSNGGALAVGDPGIGAMRQLYGDVWEWTRSPYAGYPGYRQDPGALGEYNGKFMSGQYVLRGGSCVTPRSHLRATYRNFFPPQARWQFSGIRLAKDAVP